MTKTPWFDRSTPPSRAGVYERLINGYVLLSHFNGLTWSISTKSPNIPTAKLPRSIHQRSVGQAFKWRGLMEKPE